MRTVATVIIGYTVIKGYAKTVLILALICGKIILLYLLFGTYLPGYNVIVHKVRVQIHRMEDKMKNPYLQISVRLNFIINLRFYAHTRCI